MYCYFKILLEAEYIVAYVKEMLNPCLKVGKLSEFTG